VFGFIVEGIYFQLQLKSPKSQVLFSGASEKIELPYEGYDPRKLQQDVDQSSDQYSIIRKNNTLYAVPERLMNNRARKSGKLKGKSVKGN
jgi:hypothetical protein